MIELQVVKQDAERLQAAYVKALANLEEAWRAAYLAPDRDAARRLRDEANELQRTAAVLAGRVEVAKRAMMQLERER
jgi:hypothetical protein